MATIREPLVAGQGNASCESSSGSAARPRSLAQPGGRASADEDGRSAFCALPRQRRHRLDDLAVYAREMDRRDGEPERLRALVDGRVWALTGINAVPVLSDADEKVAA